MVNTRGGQVGRKLRRCAAAPVTHLKIEAQSQKSAQLGFSSSVWVAGLLFRKLIILCLFRGLDD